MCAGRSRHTTWHSSSEDSDPLAPEVIILRSMGVTKNTRHLFEDEHPELLICMSTGKPSEVYWVGPNLALTADEALSVLPRLLADAMAMKMRRSDNAAVETQLLTDILSQLRRSLHSGPRQRGDVSGLVLDTPAGRVDVMALSHQSPLNFGC